MLVYLHLSQMLAHLGPQLLQKPLFLFLSVFEDVETKFL